MNLLRMFWPKVEGPSREAQATSEAIRTVAASLLAEAKRIEEECAAAKAAAASAQNEQCQECGENERRRATSVGRHG